MKTDIEMSYKIFSFPYSLNLLANYLILFRLDFLQISLNVPSNLKIRLQSAPALFLIIAVVINRNTNNFKNTIEILRIHFVLKQPNNFYFYHYSFLYKVILSFNFNK